MGEGWINPVPNSIQRGAHAKKLRKITQKKKKKKKQRLSVMKKERLLVSYYLEYSDGCPENVIKVFPVAVTEGMFGHYFVTRAISGFVKYTKFAPK